MTYLWIFNICLLCIMGIFYPVYKYKKSLYIGICLLIPTIATGLYMIQGIPDFNDAPLSKRTEQLDQHYKILDQKNTLYKTAEIIIKKPKKTEQDWMKLYTIYDRLQDKNKTLKTVVQWHTFNKKSILPLLLHARILRMESGYETPKTVSLMEKVLHINPNTIEALLLSALYYHQNKNIPFKPIKNAGTSIQQRLIIVQKIANKNPAYAEAIKQKIEALFQ